ncbi:MAG TPA: hypothetical protein VG454_01975, partial [Gemmatimonadales bacterium]|nr:hypothetical protein [Gemmatimonadales bacterium]
AVACSDALGPDATPPLPTYLQATVTNPFFPLPLGRTQIFNTQTANGLEIDSVTVLARPGTIHGFPVTEVHDRVYLAGSITEDTYDWYAQDPDGNVWYLGEDTQQYDHGLVIGTEGTWQWGVHNALPGIVVWGDTSGKINKLYRQEFDPGNAQDVGKLVALNLSFRAPFDTAAVTGCIKTEEWSTLEKSPHEHKFYCPHVGTALEVGGSGDTTWLVKVSP